MAGKALLRVEDFQALATTAVQPGVGELMVGKDFRVYRQTRGLMTVICEADPVDETKPALYYGGVDWSQYPRMEWLADLYDRFLSQYKREVMFMVGKRHQVTEGMCPWFFMVPKQEGTPGGIEWADKEGMDWFLERARFLGTVHVHPGAGSTASSVDIGHWEEKDCSGIHVVFGRDQSFTLYGSASGHCIRITEGTIKSLPRWKAPLCHSLNRKLRKLLLVPKPVQIVRGSLFPGRSGTGTDAWTGMLHPPTKLTRPHGHPAEWGQYLHSVALMNTWGEPALQGVGRLWLVNNYDPTVECTDSYLLDEVDYKRYREQCLARGWGNAPIGVCLVPAAVDPDPGSTGG